MWVLWESIQSLAILLQGPQVLVGAASPNSFLYVTILPRNIFNLCVQTKLNKTLMWYNHFFLHLFTGNNSAPVAMRVSSIVPLNCYNLLIFCSAHSMQLYLMILPIYKTKEEKLQKHIQQSHGKKGANRKKPKFICTSFSPTCPSEVPISNLFELFLRPLTSTRVVTEYGFDRASGISKFIVCGPLK